MIVFYRPASKMAPNKVVSRHGKTFVPAKGVYAVRVEDETEFLDNNIIADAVNSSRLWRDGPYPEASDPLPTHESAPDPTPEPAPVTRRSRAKKEVADVQESSGVDQDAVQPERPDHGEERVDAGGDHADYGFPADTRPDPGGESS